MLSEEALIVLGTLAGIGLLVLGVLELLWPTRPSRPVRRRPAVAARAARPHRISALARHARASGRGPYPGRLVAAPAVVASETPVALGGAADRGKAGEVAMAPATPNRPVVEGCFALYQEGRHAEAIDTALAAVAGGPGASEKAALWSVVARARQAQGEHHAAREALESAIEAAPAGERHVHRHQLAALAESVARARLADAERHAPRDCQERLAAVREAAAWLECGLAAVPAGGALAETMADCQATLWPTWERTVMTLLQAQDFRAARQLLSEALAEPRFPAALGETFRGLFSGTFSGEIGQLTARAMCSVQDAREADALGALQRAEGLLAALDDEVLPPRRREEVDRRLWWGYRALGERRLTAGACEAALEPLFHALGYRVGPEQVEETRALVLRALDGVADARALGIRQLADAGDREAALVECDELWTLVRSAGERGFSPTDLGGVHRKVARLLEALGR